MADEQLDDWYDEAYFDRYPKHQRRIRQILEHVNFQSTDVVCEFGCGLGHILLAISKDIAQGTGIDVSEYAISSAISAADKSAATNLNFQSIDIISLVDDEQYHQRFDKVLMMDISEHLYDDTLLDFLKSAHWVLKPGGMLLLHTPNAEYFLERMKAHNFIVKQFESHIAVRNFLQHEPILKSAGFSKVTVKYLPHYNRVLGLMDRVLMRIPIIRRLFRARILLTARSN
jgi:2-polyprenyl-6-hydroxyphenyl methylase / 3-demethylubiquinone-9 3-methyltransferase